MQCWWREQKFCTTRAAHDPHGSVLRHRTQLVRGFPVHCAGCSPALRVCTECTSAQNCLVDIEQGPQDPAGTILCSVPKPSKRRTGEGAQALRAQMAETQLEWRLTPGDPLPHVPGLETAGWTLPSSAQPMVRATFCPRCTLTLTCSW